MDALLGFNVERWLGKSPRGTGNISAVDNEEGKAPKERRC